MTYAHDAGCNVIHKPGPEPCPPHCDDDGHVRPEGVCPSCGSEVRPATGGVIPAGFPLAFGLDPEALYGPIRKSTAHLPISVELQLDSAGLMDLFRKAMSGPRRPPPPEPGPNLLYVALLEAATAAGPVFVELVEGRKRCRACFGRKQLPKVDQVARNAAIVEARRQGQTLKAIGDTHGLTPERVRRILEAS